MDILLGFFRLIMISTLALFPIVNPVGNAFIINNFFVELNPDQRKIIVKKVIWRSFFFCVIALFVGRFVLGLFGLSIPAIQIAGGALICRTGWLFLSDDNSDENLDEETTASSSRLKRFQYDYLLKNVFYPLTFPMVVGAGALSVLFTLAANAVADPTQVWWQTILNFAAVIVAVILTCLMLYIMLINTVVIEKKLGTEGKIIINKVSAFFTLCVGVQIAMNGLTHFIK